MAYTENFSLEGKIALIKRGDTTFEEKAKAAEAAGAKALIVYNNTSGDIRMNVGIVDIPRLCYTVVLYRALEAEFPYQRAKNRQ